MTSTVCSAPARPAAWASVLPDGKVEQTLVESWNGTSWSSTTSPDTGTGNNVLNAVSCTSSTSCVAVGFYYNGSSVAQTLVESWNGTAWSIITTPNKGTYPDGLFGVSCTSPTECTAVGVYYTRPPSRHSSRAGTGRPGRSSPPQRGTL